MLYAFHIFVAGAMPRFAQCSVYCSKESTSMEYFQKNVDILHNQVYATTFNRPGILC